MKNNQRSHFASWSALGRIASAKPSSDAKTRNGSHRFSIRAVAIGTMLTVSSLLATQAAHAAATIVIQVLDGAGVGFNDPTVTAPVGGNAGVTLGQQRLIAFQSAANTWGATLTSTVPVIIGASWAALTCTATSAVLGSAGAAFIERDFPAAPRVGTWYPIALANKLEGTDLAAGQIHIRAQFNVNLGKANCLAGVPFYLGLDNNHGTSVDLVTVLLHEFGHGLGFQTFTSGSTGAQINDGTGGKPSIADYFLQDGVTNLTWVEMSNAQRVASAISGNKLFWNGANVTAAAPGVLAQGTPLLSVNGPSAGTAAGSYAVGTASFGPAVFNPGVTADIMPVSNGGAAGDACLPLSVADALAVNGHLALINRGVCGFAVKTKNAQDAGAVGVIIGDNVAGSPPPGLGGTDPTVTIPAVRITLADTNTLRTALARRSRTSSGVLGNIGLQGSQLQGADLAGHVLMFAPNPFQGGSSVSHFDTSAFPNLLMEPAINGDLTHTVVPPSDLTFTMLRDIGW